MVTQSGIIKLEEYSAPMGGKSFDSLHLASAFKDDKPYRFGMMVAKIFSSSNKFSNKTISALTLGSGNFEVIDNNVYRWSVAGDDEINFYATELLVSPSAKVGYGNTEFEIALDHDWLEEPDQLQCEDNRYPFLSILGKPRKVGNSYHYRVKLQTSDPTAWISPEVLSPGRTFIKASSSIADEMNDKRGGDQYGSAMDYESQIGMYAAEFNITDKVVRRELQGKKNSKEKCLTSGYAFAVRRGGKVIERGMFVTDAEARLLDRVEMDREMAMVFGHASIDYDSNGYIKRTGPGFRQLAKDGHEYIHNGNMTAQTLEDYLHGIFLNRISGVDRDVVISTGEGGMRMLHQLLQDEANNFLTLDTNYIKQAKSTLEGIKNPLSFGAQFVEFNAINGIRVRLSYDPMKDDPKYCKRKHPDNPNYTIDSFRMDIYDLGSPGSTEAGVPKSNMTMLMEDLTEVYTYTSGITDPRLGPISNGSKATSLQKGVTFIRETSGSLCVWDTSRIGSIVYEPDFV